MTRVTFKDMIWFLIFNIFCVSMQVCLISSVDTDNNISNIDSPYYSNNKTNIKNDFEDIFSKDERRSLRSSKDDDNEPMTLVEGPFTLLTHQNHNSNNFEESYSPSPSPSSSSINIIDDLNDHTEDDNENQDKIISIKIANTCIVMPEEMEHCKHCEHPTYNSGMFKYAPSNHYCDIKYEMVNEIITCPHGWEEHINYRNMKKYAEHYFKCTSQKVCCLYN